MASRVGILPNSAAAPSAPRKAIEIWTGGFDSAQSARRQTSYLRRWPRSTMPQQKNTRDIRRIIYELLEQGPIGERRTRFLSRLIILLVVVNLVAAALETVPALEAQYG